MLAEFTRHAEIGEQIHVHLDEFSRETEGNYNFYFEVLEQEEQITSLSFQSHLIDVLERR